MKLIGAELANFACFNRQFIPLRNGISVLVGRNNAGKTAILRGLSVLGRIPVGEVNQPLPTDPTGYFRHGETPEIDLLCTLENSEIQHFQGAPGNWIKQVIETGIARWRFRFDRSGMVFQWCKIEIPPGGSSPDRADIIVNNDGHAYWQTLRYPDFAPAGKRQFTNRSQNGGPVFDRGNPFSAPLDSVGNVKLVNPHRVVQDSQLLQTTLELPSSGGNLAAYLQTLNGQSRDTFLAIEKFVTGVFPEFKYVNAASGPNNQVSIELTEAKSNRKIPLSNSGTGVEQILTLATFVLTTPAPGLILLDEPHSYLHPTAERALVQFLLEHTEHRYLISTHSAVLMNSVEPDRIIYIAPPGKPYNEQQGREQISKVLFDLGYRNSDSLFYDRLILVEGKSDAAIIPLLLLADGEITQAELDRTGFPTLEGVGKGKALQTSILRYEKLLGANGRADQPRMYLFDRDRKADDRNILSGTTSPNTDEQISAAFLTRLEIENYLLVPEAIATAISEELALKGEKRNLEADEISNLLTPMLHGNDEKLFPQGKQADLKPEVEIKGSRALERIYENFGLIYQKEHSGKLIAKYITAKNQGAITELAGIISPLFGKPGRT